jgi:hypothetical protein
LGYITKKSPRIKHLIRGIGSLVLDVVALIVGSELIDNQCTFMVFSINTLLKQRPYNGEEMFLWLRVKIPVRPALRKSSFVLVAEKLK